MRTTRRVLMVAASLAAIAAVPTHGMAQEHIASGASIKDTLDTHERQVQRARNGAGLRFGAWENPAPSPSGAQVSSTPAFEGYWQRGMDRHLVLETGIGVWVRSMRDASTGDRIGTYVVPMTTTLKMYPFTGPESGVEPYLAAGAGFTLGVDDRETSGGGLLGATGSSGTFMTLGFTARGGSGVEFHLNRAFGLQVGAGYQYTKMFEEIGGQRTFKGPQIGGGLTYRFQF
jgi:hypothetical protein